jgi:hypothetical protein
MRNETFTASTPCDIAKVKVCRVDNDRPWVVTGRRGWKAVGDTQARTQLDNGQPEL